jgi:hypothetical protein
MRKRMKRTRKRMSRTRRLMTRKVKRTKEDGEK